MALALCLSLLPAAALAEEHVCTEDENKDHYCDECFETLSDCVDEDHDHWCDFCGTRISECADEDEDHYCDICWEYLPDLCIDGEDEAIHVCDICFASMPKLCVNEDEDHACDLCEALIEGLCEDENSDHYCDNEACGNWISSCEDCDENEDNICDLCGEGIYPSAGELNFVAEAADGSATVTWDALPDVGDDEVASYTVSCCLEDSFEPLQQEVYEPGSDAYSHTFSGLENDVVYDVFVDAVYTKLKDGYEEPFGVTVSNTVTALPGAPTILSVVPGNGSVTLEWEAPENKGFPEILSYLIAVEQDGIGFGKEVEATDATMRYTLDELLNGETYQIYISAVNEIGQGAAATTTVDIPLIPYSLEIGGVAVTEENMNDVLGDGTVSFAPDTTTLTLNNARINVTEGNYGIRSKTHLTLKLVGKNSIACSGVYGFHSTDDVRVIGSGSLDITANDVGIYIAGGYEVGGLYLYDDVTLNVTSGNVTSGNSYGVRVDDVLEVRENATLIATAGTAPERSCGIYAYDEFNVYDNAVVTATGADQSVDLNTDGDGIRTTHITINGGTVTATGGTAATTNGIFTQTFEMNGGTLTAVSGSTAGGTRFGPSTALQATKSFNMTDGVINATSGSAGNDTSCGIWVSNGELRMEGGSVFAESGAANFSYGVKASQMSLFSGAYIGAKGAEGGWCSNGVNVEGSLIVDNGAAIFAEAASAETYSYGLQAFEMTISDSDIKAVAGSAANSYGLWAFGSMDFLCNRIRLNPHVPGFIGTKIVASAENGYAVYSRTGVEIADTLTVSAPEGGSIASFGAAEDFTAYYTAVDADGTAAESVEIEVLTYEISIKGLDIGYAMRVEVPAGWSVNETYCEKYGVEDFSEILNTEKSGYTFKGWYTDETCTAGNEFDFDDAITSDLSIYAKWSKISSGGSGGSGGSSNTKTETTRNEDGSTTKTTTNKKTGVVTETTTMKDGVTGTVVTDKKGEITEISAKVPAAAAKDGEAVTLPLEVKAADSAEDAPEIEVDVPAGGAVVEIPVKNVTPGTVVVRVNKNGSEEILMTSAVTEKGVVVTLEKDAVLKISENSRVFADVHEEDHWAADAVDFVTARGIFGGTGADTFAPNGSMTRQAMWMVLARMSGETPADMAEAQAWAVECGVSDGSVPTGSVTRQQFVTMLWRWAKAQGVDVSVGEDTNILSYEDAFTISDYAMPAVQWACGEGIMSGYADGTLRPHSTATRAHVAKMLMSFLNR